MAASSSSAQDPQNPSAPQPHPSSSTVSRRLPPPCWSPEETAALIDAYREKWYSLRRGNLRASHWQEVADAVAMRCPVSSVAPQKTSVQCRHKMEKLRKRYRAELQRAAATPTGRRRYISSWVHFPRMDSMEKGPTAVAVPLNAVPIDAEDDDDEDEDEDDEVYEENVYPKKFKNGANHRQARYTSVVNGINGNGSQIRNPGRSNAEIPPPATMYNNSDEFSTPSPNQIFRDRKNFKDGHMRNFGKSGGSRERIGKKRENDPAAEMVAAVKALGDGFVRMERMKMEMVREIESMRMEMEEKRTETILESQQRIVESFAKAICESENKKVKRMPSPES